MASNVDELLDWLGWPPPTWCWVPQVPDRWGAMTTRPDLPAHPVAVPSCALASSG
jgi:hypothetical protein